MLSLLAFSSSPIIRSFNPLLDLDPGYQPWRGSLSGNGIQGHLEHDVYGGGIRVENITQAVPRSYLCREELGAFGLRILGRARRENEILLGGDACLHLYHDYLRNHEGSMLEFFRKASGITTLVFLGMIFRENSTCLPCVLALSWEEGSWYQKYLPLGVWWRREVLALVYPHV